MAFSFSQFFGSLFGTLNAKIKTFFAGPGGAIVQQAVTNMVRIAGAEGAALLVQMAQNNIAGKPVLTGVEWDKVAGDLKQQCIAQGITASETLIDYAISQAVQANATPGAVAPLSAPATPATPTAS